MIYIAVGLALLLLAGVGVFFLVRDTQHQLAGGREQWKLKQQEKEMKEIEAFTQQLERRRVEREIEKGEEGYDGL
jgi:flagellar basal body-associated protein FliL